VHLAHELGGADAQLVVRLVDEDAPRVQLGAHRAVEQHDLGRVEQAI
jgi:hypothetical protein